MLEKCNNYLLSVIIYHHKPYLLRSMNYFNEDEFPSAGFELSLPTSSSSVSLLSMNPASSASASDFSTLSNTDISEITLDSMRLKGDPQEHQVQNRRLISRARHNGKKNSSKHYTDPFQQLPVGKNARWKGCTSENSATIYPLVRPIRKKSNPDLLFEQQQQGPCSLPRRKASNPSFMGLSIPVRKSSCSNLQQQTADNKKNALLGEYLCNSSHNSTFATRATAATSVSTRGYAYALSTEGKHGSATSTKSLALDLSSSATTAASTTTCLSTHSFLNAVPMLIPAFGPLRSRVMIRDLNQNTKAATAAPPLPPPLTRFKQIQ